jgi:hypothetical protein
MRALKGARKEIREKIQVRGGLCRIAVSWHI